MLVAKPVRLTTAIVGTEEFQVTWLVRICVDESLKVPVAWYCCVLPRPRCTPPVGVIASVFSVALVVVTLDRAPWPPNAAPIMAVPGALPVTHPNDPGESEIVATGPVNETAGGEIATNWAEAEIS